MKAFVGIGLQLPRQFPVHAISCSPLARSASKHLPGSTDLLTPGWPIATSWACRRQVLLELCCGNQICSVPLCPGGRLCTSMIHVVFRKKCVCVVHVHMYLSLYIYVCVCIYAHEHVDMQRPIRHMYVYTYMYVCT